MIRRTVSLPKADAQLGLPFGDAAKSEPPVQMPGDPISVRVAEAIRLTGIGRSKLYELIASGDIEAIKVGRCTLIPMTSLRALVCRGAP